MKSPEERPSIDASGFSSANFRASRWFENRKDDNLNERIQASHFKGELASELPVPELGDRLARSVLAFAFF